MMPTMTARLFHRLLATLALVLLGASAVQAVTLDNRGEMRLGMRAYTAARFGTEAMGGDEDPLSFPHSAPGHMRQHRYFLSLKLDHDILRLATTTKGFAWLFGGFLKPNVLSYSVQYRGEGDGLYDYGPDEFSDQEEAMRAVRLDVPDLPPLSKQALEERLIDERVDRLRRNARQRHRLFLAYLDVEKGPVFVRIGRQILAWGETDQFRLLDNINPLDQGFGGFFIPLDERRVPLDMVRASYHFGSFWKLADTFLEGFVAVGNKVSTSPGIIAGSPWQPGGLGFPNPAVRFRFKQKDPTDVRGGARLVFTLKDVTYSLAHYYTRLDTPTARFLVPGAPEGGTSTPGPGNPIIADVLHPRVAITGGSLTFPVPAWYTIVRSEFAFIHDESFNRQGRGRSAWADDAPGTPGYRRLVQADNLEGGLDPFVFPGFYILDRRTPIRARGLERDTINASIGLDINRFIRQLNPTQTFFFSTQLLYKHVIDAPEDLILPVPHHNIAVNKSLPIAGTLCTDGKNPGNECRVRPRFFHLNQDQFLHTLLVSTSYFGGRVIPQFVAAYDWQGVWLSQPGVTLVRDPFRFVFDYTRIDGGPTAQIGTLRDRDNVRVQAEYVF
jgi:hypothetical protein